jgi:hypothetical protein
VQALRAKAQAAGNLQSNTQQQVRTDASSGKTVYVIESPKPDVIYVPTYNPYTIYGTWWYPAPPYYMYPPAYVYPPGLAFTTGVFVGAAIWGGCNWGSSRVDININHYNQFNRTTINNTNWDHNSANRRGVAYGDKNVASQYDRGADQRSAQREQFRGRTDSAGGALQNNSGAAQRAAGSGDLGSRAGTAGGSGSRDFGGGSSGSRDFAGGSGSRDLSGSSGSRDFSSRDFAGASSRGGSGGAFSGASGGDAMRSASARGGASRGGMGGGGGGGGRRR